MVRVLHVIGAMDRGGAETMVMNIYRAIDREQFQFDFLVHEDRACDYDEEIESLGGRIYRVPRFNGLNLVSYSRACRKILSEHPEWHVVHGHIGSSAAVYLHEANKLGRYTIAHSHAKRYLQGASDVLFQVVSFPTRFVADRFFACSEEAGVDRFGSRVVGSDRFEVVNNGIDLALYQCDEADHERLKQELGVEDAPAFVHVGRFEEVKNHRFLLETFARIQSLLPGAVLLLVGRGPLEEDMRGYAVSLGIQDCVRFLGVRNDVPEILKGCDVFVFPSTSEGLAMAVVEAQAAGLEVIASDGVPGLAIVTEGAYRIPLQLGAEAWAASCIEAYARSSARKFHDRAFEVASHGFDISNVAAHMEDVYRAADRFASSR